MSEMGATEVCFRFWITRRGRPGARDPIGRAQCEAQGKDNTWERWPMLQGRVTGCLGAGLDRALG